MAAHATSLILFFLHLTSRTSGFLLTTRRLWLRLRGFSRGRTGGWGAISWSDQQPSSVSLSCRPPGRYPVGEGTSRAKLNICTSPELILPAFLWPPEKQTFPGLLWGPFPLTNWGSASGYLVFQVEGILVGGGRGVRNRAQVLHGEAPQPSS